MFPVCSFIVGVTYSLSSTSASLVQRFVSHIFPDSFRLAHVHVLRRVSISVYSNKEKRRLEGEGELQVEREKEKSR